MTATATTSPARSTSGSRPLWRRLLHTTPVGWTIGIIVGVLLIVIAESAGLQELQSPLVLGVALGISAFQQRALRPILAGSGARWIVLSSLGLAAPFLLYDAANLAGRAPAYNLVAYVICGGIIISFIQWSILRTRVERAGGWLIASPLGYSAAAATVWLNDAVLPKTPGMPGLLQYVAVILAGGVLLGLATALAAAGFQPHAGEGAAPLT